VSSHTDYSRPPGSVVVVSVVPVAPKTRWQGLGGFLVWDNDAVAAGTFGGLPGRVPGRGAKRGQGRDHHLPLSLALAAAGRRRRDEGVYGHPTGGFGGRSAPVSRIWYLRGAGCPIPCRDRRRRRHFLAGASRADDPDGDSTPGVGNLAEINLAGGFARAPAGRAGGDGRRAGAGAWMQVQVGTPRRSRGAKDVGDGTQVRMIGEL